MAYTKIIYQDSPSTATPLNAQNLNHMDDGIAENDRRLNDLAIHNVKSFNGREGDIVSANGDYDITQIAPTTGATVGQIPILTNVGTEEEPVLEFQMQDVPQTGHTIQGADGTNLAQEPTMQFADLHTSDDSAHLKTVIQAVKAVIQSDYSSETEDGIYLVTDGDGAVIEPASEDYVQVVADGVKTYQTLLYELYSAIDYSKLTPSASLVIGVIGDEHVNIISRVNQYNIRFGRISSGATDDVKVYAIQINNVLANCHYTSGNVIRNTYDSYDSTVPTSGDKLTLYYGNKKATVDLQTTANRCWMGNGESVESAINSISYKKAGFAGTTSAAGLLPLTGYEYLDGYRILCVESCTLENVTYTIAHGTTPNYIVFNSIGGQSVANQNVTVVFYYTRV